MVQDLKLVKQHSIFLMFIAKDKVFLRQVFQNYISHIYQHSLCLNSFGNFSFLAERSYFILCSIIYWKNFVRHIPEKSFLNKVIILIELHNAGIILLRQPSFLCCWTTGTQCSLYIFLDRIDFSFAVRTEVIHVKIFDRGKVLYSNGKVMFNQHLHLTFWINL